MTCIVTCMYEQLLYMLLSKAFVTKSTFVSSHTSMHWVLVLTISINWPIMLTQDSNLGETKYSVTQIQNLNIFLSFFRTIKNGAGQKNSLVHPEWGVCHFGHFSDLAIFTKNLKFDPSHYWPSNVSTCTRGVSMWISFQIIKIIYLYLFY